MQTSVVISSFGSMQFGRIESNAIGKNSYNIPSVTFLIRLNFNLFKYY